MALVNWHFGATNVGSDRPGGEPSHVCEAREHAREEPELLEGILAPMLAATAFVTRPEARVVLIELDPARATITASLTDRARTRDEPDVYRLLLGDWVPDASDATDEGRARLETRLRGLVRMTLGRQSLNPTLEYLTSQGFEFYLAVTGRAQAWEPLDTRPAPVNVVQLRTRRDDH